MPNLNESMETQIDLAQRVPLLDIGRENGPLESDILSAMTKVCRSGQFIMGSECQRLEQQIASLCGVRHAIGCASGSDALLLALMALGVQRDDEVIVPSFTFFATASAVWRLGAKPVFVDIDPITFNMEPELIAASITPATRAIIPVHLFGQPADMTSINQIAKTHNLFVVEDAAQAIAAKFNGIPVGSFGDVGCMSFYPTKNLGGFGDGGMLTTSNDELAAKLHVLRNHGMKPRYLHQEVGVNSRLDSIQAAVLNVKLPNLRAWTKKRQANANRYHELFSQMALTEHVVLPTHAAGRDHVWNQYTIRVGSGLRDALRAHLQTENIGTEIYYPVPLHRQACFKNLGYGPESLPETERASAEVLSLPVFPEMTDSEQQTVVHHIRDFFSRRPVVAPSATLQPSIIPSASTATG